MNKGFRLAAIQTLSAVLQHNDAITAHLSRERDNISTTDKAIFQRVCIGTLQQFESLTWLSQQLLSKPLKKKDADIFIAILIGLYQLRSTNIPAHAAISETVNATKKLKKRWTINLVNAVLRQYQRQKSELEQHLSTQSARFNLPPWLLHRVTQAWPDYLDDIASVSASIAPLTLRINQRKISREHYLQTLSDHQISAQPCSHSPQGVTVSRRADVTSLPGFHTGWFSVQDEAAQLAAHLLDLNTPNLRVLDACCAPGGKTCHILETQDVILTAVELEPKRLDKVKENLSRLDLNANLHIADIRDIAHWWDNIPFDRILLDVPCSATGVLRRHPDIKQLRRDSDIAQLVELQQKMLHLIWPLLKPNGLMVYATCSILPEENSLQVKHFIDQTRDAILVDMPYNWGIKQPAGRQLLPQANGHDGFYYAVIRKGDV